MRKTSAYARRRRREGKSVEPGVMPLAEFSRWQHEIRIRQSYGDGGLEEVAMQASNLTLVALTKFLEHSVKPDDYEPHDALAHAIGVATLRAIEIHGGTEGNPALQILDAGRDALLRTRQRWEQTKQWGLDGPARQQLSDAVDVYQEILMASSPLQMQKACDLRYEILTGKKQDPRYRTIP